MIESVYFFFIRVFLLLRNSFGVLNHLMFDTVFYFASKI